MLVFLGVNSVNTVNNLVGTLFNRSITNNRNNYQHTVTVLLKSKHLMVSTVRIDLLEVQKLISLKVSTQPILRGFDGVNTFE